jgi:hypothetical protein
VEAAARVALDQGRQYRLTLTGRLSPLWAGDLTSGLAAHRVGILSGWGRGSGLDWTAELLLDFSASTAIPEGIDYVRLTSSGSGADLNQALRVSRHVCARLPSGLLDVRVFGPDQPDFLARLLGRMAMVVLFPTEFEINTRGGMIDDRFVLGGPGHAAPAPAAERFLDDLLTSWEVQ